MLGVQRAVLVLALLAGGSFWGCGASPAIKPPLAATASSPVAVVAEPPRQPRGAPGEQVVRAVATATFAACALLEDTTVWCWGSDHTGASDDNRLTQVPLVGVTKLLGGGDRFLALTAAGGLFVWGELGIHGRQVISAQPYPVVAGPVIDATLTYQVLCVLEQGGRISCWNDEGVASPPVVIPQARRLAISEETRCALLVDGSVTCWTDEQAPAMRSGLSDVSELVADGNLHCARRNTGIVSCWSSKGENTVALEQLGREASHLSATPEAICSFGERGLPRCFGVRWSLPREDQVRQASEVFKPSTKLSQISVELGHACAVADGVVWCWGDQSIYGVLGNTRELPEGLQLVQVSLGDTASLRHVQSVAVSNTHHCVVLGDGQMRCWGNNDHGQLGIAAGESGLGPSPVVGISNVTSIAVNDDTTCAIQTDGTLRCWGALSLSAAGAKQVGLGNGYGCLLTRGHAVRCWGENSMGELGTADVMPHPEPAPVLLAGGRELTDVARLRVFSNHACAITSSHQLYCWGGNREFDQGRPYNGPAMLKVATPLKVADGVRDVSDRCLLTESSELRCWGDVFASPDAFSYEPVRVGRCAVDALSPGPGACFADAGGWSCLGWGEPFDGYGDVKYVRLEAPGLSAVSGTTSELCGIAASGRLACFRPDSYQLRPSLGPFTMAASEVPARTTNCQVDKPPRSLPKFPPVAAASVLVQAASHSDDGSIPSPTIPGVKLSQGQVTRLLALLNDRNNYTNIATCHEDDYYYLFYDAAGEELASVGVGGCGTLEAYPAIPAQHGKGNVIEPKLSSGLRQICRELGLEICRER